jgi:hypothetical protein
MDLNHCVALSLLPYNNNIAPVPTVVNRKKKKKEKKRRKKGRPSGRPEHLKSYEKILALEPFTSLAVTEYLVLPVVATSVLTLRPAALNSLILAGS